MSNVQECTYSFERLLNESVSFIHTIFSTESVSYSKYKDLF